MAIKKQLDAIAQAIFDKKGVNILALDVRGFSTMTEYYLIAEGSVGKHVKALSTAVTDGLKEKPIHTEGFLEGDWVVMDYGELVIHLMIPEMREKYALEELWHEGKIVDLDIKTG
jgi:ribosome-associated protein